MACTGYNLEWKALDGSGHYMVRNSRTPKGV